MAFCKPEKLKLSFIETIYTCPKRCGIFQSPKLALAPSTSAPAGEDYKNIIQLRIRISNKNTHFSRSLFKFLFRSFSLFVCNYFWCLNVKFCSKMRMFFKTHVYKPTTSSYQALFWFIFVLFFIALMHHHGSLLGKEKFQLAPLNQCLTSQLSKATYLSLSIQLFAPWAMFFLSS